MASGGAGIPIVPSMGPAETALRQTLTTLADGGRRVPCMERDEWISDGKDDRAYAAGHCQHCPALDACRTAADEIQPLAGIWGGRIYPRPAT